MMRFIAGVGLVQLGIAFGQSKLGLSEVAEGHGPREINDPRNDRMEIGIPVPTASYGVENEEIVQVADDPFAPLFQSSPQIRARVECLDTSSARREAKAAEAHPGQLVIESEATRVQIAVTNAYLMKAFDRLDNLISEKHSIGHVPEGFLTAREYSMEIKFEGLRDQVKGVISLNCFEQRLNMRM